MFNGTTRTDRAIVNITYTDGKTYTVKDELVPFRICFIVPYFIDCFLRGHCAPPRAGTSLSFSFI